MSDGSADRRRWWLTGLAVLIAGGIAAGTLLEPDPASPGGTGDHGSKAVPDAALPSGTAAVGEYVFPVAGKVSYARTHHDYPASDVIAPCGSTVRAVHAGTVLEVSRTDGYDAKTDDGAKRGGRFVSVLGDDGVRYYGSHLRTVAAEMKPGVRVHAGQSLGTVGDSGRAGVCHLHFGISPPCAGRDDWWIRRGTVWPWSYLDSWRNRGAASPAGAVAAWVKAHGCPDAPA